MGNHAIGRTAPYLVDLCVRRLDTPARSFGAGYTPLYCTKKLEYTKKITPKLVRQRVSRESPRSW
jgi:hypothetical protein